MYQTRKHAVGIISTVIVQKVIVIKVKEVPIKAYNSIKKVKQYYILLYCVYKIISLKLKSVNKELTL